MSEEQRMTKEQFRAGAQALADHSETPPIKDRAVWFVFRAIVYALIYIGMQLGDIKDELGHLRPR